MAEDLTFLLSRVSLGDRKAFAALYRETSPRLYGLALGMLRRRDDAEEVIQDVYVSLWHSARTYDAGRGSVNTWLTTVVRNRCIDRLRRRDLLTTQLDDNDWENLESPRSSPLQDAIRHADTQALARCLEHLDDRQRESLQLAYFQGLSHSELAVRLTAPLGTVKAWVRRGLERLRQCMQP